MFSHSRGFSTLDENSRNQQHKELKKSKPDYIYGLNPVLASLTANRREFSKLYLNIELKNEGSVGNAKIEQIRMLANHYKIKIKFMGKKNLSDFTGSRPHQNVVLKASRLEYHDIKYVDDVYEASNHDGAVLRRDQGLVYLFLD